jgi:flagellar basal body-associated protein FliL
MSKVNISDFFLEWFQQTNPHLFKGKMTKKELSKEVEEYINDVLEEHMEAMANYEFLDDNDNDNDDDDNK